MNDLDTIKLWVLSETAVSNTVPLSHFLGAPEDKTWLSPWIFPDGAVRQSSVDDRKTAVLDAIEQGWVAMLDPSVEDGLRFSSDVNERCSGAIDHAQRASLMLLSCGHEKWVETYQPMWRRYWASMFAEYTTDGEQKIRVTYASNEILDELIEWFPAYMGLGRSAEPLINYLATEYFYPATVWHRIPRVKTAEFTMPGSDPAWCPVDETTDPVRWSAKFNTTNKTLAADQEKARNVLRTLSGSS